MNTLLSQGEQDFAPSQPAIADGPIVVAPLSVQPVEPPPKRRTPYRLQAYFLRQLARSGCQAEAAARTGVTSRTVQRWRAANPQFAARYDTVLSTRVEILEDAAMQRALGMDRRSVFHRDREVATVERHNDAMLMRVLARFDRLREKEAAKPKGEPPVDLEKLSDFELLKLAGWPVPEGLPEHEALAVAYKGILRELEDRLSEMSPFERQACEQITSR
jgi:hypothetical protein